MNLIDPPSITSSGKVADLVDILASFPYTIPPRFLPFVSNPLSIPITENGLAQSAPTAEVNPQDLPAVDFGASVPTSYQSIEPTVAPINTPHSLGVPLQTSVRHLAHTGSVHRPQTTITWNEGIPLGSY